MPASPPKRPNDEGLPESLRRLTEYALRLVPSTIGRTAQVITPRRGLYLLRQYERTAFEATIYDPMLCLILQGCKEMTFGEHSFRLHGGECALVSHDLPIVSRVREAPYLVLLLNIEIEVLRSLWVDLGELATGDTEARALEVHQADVRLLDVIGRYLALGESETDERVLGPMLLREIHYRLLADPLGRMLQSLVRPNSHARSIAHAIALLRRDFRSPMVVVDLARAVGMSVSSLHKHFKAVTSTSPLQYQKGLRLLEARRLLVSGAASVSTVAFEVNYESPTQFSREYARKFGRPPNKDLQSAHASRS